MNFSCPVAPAEVVVVVSWHFEPSHLQGVISGLTPTEQTVLSLLVKRRRATTLYSIH